MMTSGKISMRLIQEKSSKSLALAVMIPTLTTIHVHDLPHTYRCLKSAGLYKSQ